MGRAVAPAELVLAIYAIWIGTYLAAGNDVRDFITLGPRFVFQGIVEEARHHPGPPRIGLERGYHLSGRNNGYGFDGQFSYYIAVDPTVARYYMDLSSLRYSRILQPILARGLALGNRGAIPWTLLLINWLAVAAGTWVLAAWFVRRGRSPWWALLYGLWPGMLVTVQRDLTEPLAYALVLVGALLVETRGRWRLPAAGLAFALAGLARQTTLVFPVVYALWLAFGGSLGCQPPARRGERWREALGLLALSLAPYAAYSSFLDAWLGSVTSGGQFSPIPFGGIFHSPFLIDHQGIDVTFVVLPLLVCVVAFYPRRRLWDESCLLWFLLVANLLANLGFYGLFYLQSYTDIGPVSIGIVISAVMCASHLGDIRPRSRAWLAGATTLAMAPLPVVAVQGFISLSS